MITEEQLLWIFAENGYSLTGVREVDTASFTLENAVFQVLEGKYDYNPRLLEGIPVLMKRNLLSEEFLFNFAEATGRWNSLGYFLDFAVNEIHLSKFHDLLNRVHERKSPDLERVCYFDEFDDFFIKFQKSEEKKWNVFGAPDYNSLRKKIKVYCSEK